MTKAENHEKPLKYPRTAIRKVTDVYNDRISIVDDYRWLENSLDPEVRRWVDNQNRLTQNYMISIPARERIRDRLKYLYSKAPSSYYSGIFRGKYLFFTKRDSTKQQPSLVRFEYNGEIGPEVVVFDPNEFDRTGSTSIDFFIPSRDGKSLAICLSEGGSEDGSLHFFNAETGEKLQDVLPRVNFPTAGGSAEWNSDSSGIYYTRYPSRDQRPEDDMHFYQQVYFHKIGTGSGDDIHVIGKDFPRIAEIRLTSPDTGSGLLATVANGDGGDFSHFYMRPDGSWVKLTDFDDGVKSALFSPDGKEIFFLSRKGAPRGKIIRMPADSLDIQSAIACVEAREGSIEYFVISDSRIFVTEVVGGPSKLFSYDRHDGSFITEIFPSTDAISSIDEMTNAGKETVLIRSESFLSPPSWYWIDSSLEIRRTKISGVSPIDTSPYEVKREFVVSKDDTRIPVNIIMRRGTERDGNNTVILYGYGGYGVNLKPAFQVHVLAWIDQGGIYAIANLRGGGEYGEEWHKAGMMLKKQTVFDDFISCAEYLIRSGYTSQDKLAIEGGSNGGLLMGAALTQRPDLFRAVVSHVGIYDMIRVESQDNGAFNITEFGTVRDQDQFNALYAYSPYHRVVDGKRYPAVLLLSGENDGRVDPSHSRKMAAILQRASSSGQPVLLRMDKSGHGFGTPLDQRIDQDSDVYSFLQYELGICR
ncbi:MAG: prolyl oligopeptidase family serine peptidase [Thermoplasmataceae archaeon]